MQNIGVTNGDSKASTGNDTERPPRRPRTPPPPIVYSWKEKNPRANLFYLRDASQTDLILATLNLQGPLGLDIEWKPIFVKSARENPVALLQLANAERVLLIQLSCMQSFPAKLRELLEDPDIVKTGVGIQGDVLKLYNDFGVSTRSCIALPLLARSVDNARWKGRYNDPIGLARLTAYYEDRNLLKGKITRSNWEANPLSELQQEYAANDAHAGYVLYVRLLAMLHAMPKGKVPKPSYYSFDAIRGRLCEPSGIMWNPYNPAYDPGPPPSPPPPRPPKAETSAGQAKAASVPTTTAPRKPHPRVSKGPFVQRIQSTPLSGSTDTSRSRSSFSVSQVPRTVTSGQARSAAQSGQHSTGRRRRPPRAREA